MNAPCAMALARITSGLVRDATRRCLSLGCGKRVALGPPRKWRAVGYMLFVICCGLLRLRYYPESGNAVPLASDSNRQFCDGARSRMRHR